MGTSVRMCLTHQWNVVKSCVIPYEVGLIQNFESVVVFRELFQPGVTVWLLQSVSGGDWRYMTGSRIPSSAYYLFVQNEKVV